MRKFFCLITTLIVFCSNSYAFSVTGAQGYGLFGFEQKHTFGLASIMSAGIKINDYIEIKYFSVDTSFRMPILPFRIKDVKYQPSTDSSGHTTYTFFDSDLIGIELSYPINKYVIPSIFYGIGRGKLYDITMDTPTAEISTMIMRHDTIHALGPTIKANFDITESFFICPVVGAIFFYMGDKLRYKHAYSYFMALSVFYKM